MRKQIIFLFFTAMAFVSCSTNDKVSISINVTEPLDSTAIYFSKLSVNRIIPSDTVYLKQDRIRHKVSVIKSAPEFLYISLGGKTAIPLLVSAGEKLEIKLDNEGNLLSMTGSEESLKLQKVQADIDSFNAKFDSVMFCLNNAVVAGNNAEIARLKTELGKMLIYRKRESIKQIYKDPKSMSVLPIFYQKTNSDIPVFSQSSDAILFQRIYDSLATKYSASPFLIAFADEIARRKALFQMENKIRWAEKEDFPEVALPDINGETKRLSSYKGKLIALIFWDVNDVKQRVFNTELKPVYEKYHKYGFEVFQVALTSDKTAWALHVREQNIPWVSVCDLAAESSPAALSYNVKKLPAMFLIDKNAEIIATNLFDLQLLDGEIHRQL